MSDYKDPNDNSSELENETTDTQETGTSEIESEANATATTDNSVANSSSGSNSSNDIDNESDEDDEDPEEALDINHGKVEPVNIVDELKTSYLDYAMSVIMGRALPDARDGFKPVHRRVIYAMHKDGHVASKGTVKSAEIVGKVMGLFHPHGDSAIYDTLVRMAQDFSLRYPLVKPQGNFGGRGNESAAAMRYTEASMSRLAEQLVADIDKQTVDFIPNYSNKELEPLVLPTRIPNLLINGSAGIAVGMATSIPPHNLTEVINGCIAYLDNPNISIDELMQYIPAPDFPTGCTILGREGIREAYHTGRGKLYLRATYQVKEEGQISIVNITELPYQVNYEHILTSITDLIKNGEVEGITEVKNLTKGDINIQLRIHRDHDPHVVMNHLFAKTQLQTSISFNMLALYNGKPELLNLKQIIQIFVDFRREVITRRSVFELNKSRARTHILEALSVALANIDEIIHIIRTSQDSAEATERLMTRGWKYDILASMLAGINADVSIARPEFLDKCYGINETEQLYYLTPEQTDAILKMPLSRLTGLEQGKITKEYQDIVFKIIELIAILNSPKRLNEVLREELQAVVPTYNAGIVLDYNSDSSKNKVKKSPAELADRRLSVISDANINSSEIDFVTKEEVVITITRDGYIKSQALSEYRSQNRGGRGRSSTKIKEEDIIDNIVICNSVDTILMFTNLGRVYSIPAYKLPKGTAQSRGRALVNYIAFTEGEKIATMLAVNEDDVEGAENKYLVFVTEKGLIKKTALTKFLKIRQSGIICFMLNRANVLTSLYGIPTLSDDEQDLTKGVDRLAQVCVGSDNDIVYMVTASGFTNAFPVNRLNPVNRRSLGVVGMKIQSADDRIVGMFVSPADSTDSICTITASGYAKRTDLNLIPVRKSRAGSGVKIHKLNEKVATEVMATTQLNDNDQIVIITNTGRMLRVNAVQIRNVNRISQGLLTIRLENDEFIVDIERVVNGVLIEQEGQLETTSETETNTDISNLDNTNLDDTVLEDDAILEDLDKDYDDLDNVDVETDQDKDRESEESINLDEPNID